VLVQDFLKAVVVSDVTRRVERRRARALALLDDHAERALGGTGIDDGKELVRAEPAAVGDLP
jgi:hypothetical protein